MREKKFFGTHNNGKVTVSSYLGRMTLALTVIQHIFYTENVLTGYRDFLFNIQHL